MVFRRWKLGCEGLEEPGFESSAKRLKSASKCGIWDQKVRNPPAHAGDGF